MRIVFAGIAIVVALAAEPGRAGEVRGTVRYAGSAPVTQPIPAIKDQSTCGTSVRDESLEMSAGRLKNVILVARGVDAAPPPPSRIVLDQERCRFQPHVQAASVGSTLEILNGDPVLHNVHGTIGSATVFNLAMPLKGQRIPKTLTRPGLLKIRCDVHSWMIAYVLVADAPYAVVGDDGSFLIRGLPPGRYTLTAWHEKLGEKTAQVTVPEKGEVVSDFTYGG